MSLATTVVNIPDRGTTFADLMPSERTRWLTWAHSHDWGAAAWFDDDHVMRGLVDHQHDGRGWETYAARSATGQGLRDWAGY